MYPARWLPALLTVAFAASAPLFADYPAKFRTYTTPTPDGMHVFVMLGSPG
jgi:hypothetical protein